jgi:glucose/arabinose dehydrogenase
VWRLDGDKLTLLFQGSKKYRTPLNAVRCVALDRDGKLLAGDSATRDAYRFDDKLQPQPLTMQGIAGKIGIPMDIVVDRDGQLIVADLELHRIVKVPPGGGDVQKVADVTAPRGLFLDSQQRLWVVSTDRRLLRIAPDGKQETIVDKGVFQFPHQVAVREDGTAFVSDGYAKAIWKIAPSKAPEKWVSGEPLRNPVGLDIQGEKVFVADPHAKAVFEIDAQGKITRRSPA